MSYNNHDNNFEPSYEPFKDYTTNAPSYYDYLAQEKTHLASMLYDLDKVTNGDLINAIETTTPNRLTIEIIPQGVHRYKARLGIKDKPVYSSDGSAIINNTDDYVDVSVNKTEVLRQIFSSNGVTASINEANQLWIGVDFTKVQSKLHSTQGITLSDDGTLGIDFGSVQAKLKAGEGIRIEGDTIINEVHDTTYSAGEGIIIEGTRISVNPDSLVVNLVAGDYLVSDGSKISLDLPAVKDQLIGHLLESDTDGKIGVNQVEIAHTLAGNHLFQQDGVINVDVPEIRDTIKGDLMRVNDEGKLGLDQEAAARTLAGDYLYEQYQKIQVDTTKLRDLFIGHLLEADTEGKIGINQVDTADQLAGQHLFQKDGRLNVDAGTLKDLLKGHLLLSDEDGKLGIDVAALLGAIKGFGLQEIGEDNKLNVDTATIAQAIQGLHLYWDKSNGTLNVSPEGVLSDSEGWGITITGKDISVDTEKVQKKLHDGEKIKIKDDYLEIEDKGVLDYSRHTIQRQAGKEREWGLSGNTSVSLSHDIKPTRISPFYLRKTGNYFCIGTALPSADKNWEPTQNTADTPSGAPGFLKVTAVVDDQAVLQEFFSVYNGTKYWRVGSNYGYNEDGVKKFWEPWHADLTIDTTAYKKENDKYDIINSVRQAANTYWNPTKGGAGLNPEKDSGIVADDQLTSYKLLHTKRNTSEVQTLSTRELYRGDSNRTSRPMAIAKERFGRIIYRLENISNSHVIITTIDTSQNRALQLMRFYHKSLQDSDTIMDATIKNQRLYFVTLSRKLFMIDLIDNIITEVTNVDSVLSNCNMSFNLSEGFYYGITSMHRTAKDQVGIDQLFIGVARTRGYLSGGSTNEADNNILRLDVDTKNSNAVGGDITVTTVKKGHTQRGLAIFEASNGAYYAIFGNELDNDYNKDLTNEEPTTLNYNKVKGIGFATVQAQGSTGTGIIDFSFILKDNMFLTGLDTMFTPEFYNASSGNDWYSDWGYNQWIGSVCFSIYNPSAISGIYSVMLDATYDSGDVEPLSLVEGANSLTIPSVSEDY